VKREETGERRHIHTRFDIYSIYSMYYPPHPADISLARIQKEWEGRGRIWGYRRISILAMT